MSGNNNNLVPINANKPMSSMLTFNPELVPATTFDMQLMRYMEILVHKYCDGSAVITDTDLTAFQAIPENGARNMVVQAHEDSIEFKLITRDEAQERADRK